MNKQLTLSIEELKEMGFTERVYPATPPNEINPYGSKETTLMQIKTVNGYFSYDPDPKNHVYKWYHVTEIREEVVLNCPKIFKISWLNRIDQLLDQLRKEIESHGEVSTF